MNDAIERLRAANPFPDCDPPPRSVLASAFDPQRPALGRDRLRRMPSFGAGVALAAAVLAVGIFVVGVTVMSRSTEPQMASTGSGSVGERSLSSVVGTLARPQSAADRGIVSSVRAIINRDLPVGDFVRPDYSTVRIVGPGRPHSQLVFVALGPVPSDAFARLPEKDRRYEQDLMGRWRIVLIQVGGRQPGVLLNGDTAARVQDGAAWESSVTSNRTWSMVVVVPDGVARVVVRGASGPVITLRVHNNVAAAWHLHGKLRWPRTMIWYGADGNVLALIGPDR